MGETRTERAQRGCRVVHAKDDSGQPSRPSAFAICDPLSPSQDDPLSPSQEAIFRSRVRYPTGMTKRLIDVNDEKLESVRTLLGTGTLKATVDGAFDEVLALDERRRALLAERGVDLQQLADSDTRQAAWR